MNTLTGTCIQHIIDMVFISLTYCANRFKHTFSCFDHSLPKQIPTERQELESATVDEDEDMGDDVEEAWENDEDGDGMEDDEEDDEDEEAMNERDTSEQASNVAMTTTTTTTTESIEEVVRGKMHLPTCTCINVCTCM